MKTPFAPARLILCCLLAAGLDAAFAAETLTLAGEWRFALDRSDAGMKEAWFNRDLADRIQLPGVLQSQGYGDEISTNTPWVLSLYDKNWFQRDDYRAYTQPGNVKVPFVCQPPRHYLGAAWYQRDLEIPTNWIGRRMELFLERTRWETRAWLDDRLLGTNNSLCVPHEFEAGVVGEGPDQIKPGKHRLTVRVDNRMLMPYRPDAHAVSDSLNSTWNGIVGKIELRSTPLVWIEDVKVWPNFDRQSAVVEVMVGNATGMRGKGMVRAWSGGMTNTSSFPDAAVRVHWDANKDDREPEDPPQDPEASAPPIFKHGIVRIELPARQAWDEFSPSLQKVKVQLVGDSVNDTREVTFGLRDFKAIGQDFNINGRPTHLRGTHHGGDFALTGYPPCEVEYWLKVFRTCKEWGLNHVRFHSFCPPEAAFTAADRVGIYLQIEPGMWNDISPGTPMEAMLYAETERILKAYGNHPSFVLMSASNEAKGRWKEALPKWVKHYRAVDPRRLYTPDTGWSLIDDPGPVDGADFLAVHRIGQRLMRGERGWFGRDYASAMVGVNVPNIVHENGQWCAYPDFDVIQKFTGYMRPGNYEIFRDSLSAHGLVDRNQDFAWASGRFQLACYKEEIEANLRTRGLGGFQLLDLHDYVGQGTALVGVLDPFWESKGYVAADEWRQFCSPVVPLARLTKRVFTTADKFEVPVEVANYSGSVLNNAALTWNVLDARGQSVQRGTLAGRPPDVGTLKVGRTPDLGFIVADLSKLPTPGQYELVVQVAEKEQHRNTWNFWLYPSQPDSTMPTNVLLTHSWAEAEAKLAEGGRVIFQPPQANLQWNSPPLDKLPVFWNRLMGPGWSRMLGLWCDTNHPALADFPTAANCDWQWTEIIKTRAMNLEGLPKQLTPIVSAIDDWNRNWKLGLIWEARVGQGRLLVATFDLENESPVARQLRRSLLNYAASVKFQPKVDIAPQLVREQWFDTLVMRRLTATATANVADARAAIDGDPNTSWLTPAPERNRSAAPRPHSLTVSFPQSQAIDGAVLMNRQNDRDHQGDIRDYVISASDDGSTWNELLRGELPSTWAPQTIRFPKTITTKQLRLTALSGYGNDQTSALAEFAIIPPDAVASDSDGLRIDYRKAKSTSTDIDEGGTTAP
jgi:beta-galactosidase